MELKFGQDNTIANAETNLLIEPYGIEIRLSDVVRYGTDHLLIEPYGIEITL